MLNLYFFFALVITLSCKTKGTGNTTGEIDQNGSIIKSEINSIPPIVQDTIKEPPPPTRPYTSDVSFPHLRPREVGVNKRLSY